MVDDAVPRRSLRPFAGCMALSLTLAWAVLTVVSGHAESSPAQNRTVHVIQAWMALQSLPPTAAGSVITARQCPGTKADISFVSRPFATVYDVPGAC